MKPLRDFVLIEKVHEEVSAGGIYLPEGVGSGDLCSGIVTDIGSKIVPMDEDINIGSKVFFLRDQNFSSDTAESLVHISKILAVDDERDNEKEEGSPIKLIEWDDYKTDEYDNLWKELTSFRSFSFQLRYMKPFVQITKFQREMYEIIVQHITMPMIGTHAEIVLTGDKDKDELGFIV